MTEGLDAAVVDRSEEDGSVYIVGSLCCVQAGWTGLQHDILP